MLLNAVFWTPDMNLEQLWLPANDQACWNFQHGWVRHYQSPNLWLRIYWPLMVPEGEKVIFFGSMVTDFNGWLYTHAGIGSTNQTQWFENTGNNNYYYLLLLKLKEGNDIITF